MYLFTVLQTSDCMHHVGLKFPNDVCNGCHANGVEGFLWHCVQCFEYVLCTLCYLAGKHILRHKFDCCLTRDRQRYGCVCVG